jgi:hypothetical protein
VESETIKNMVLFLEINNIGIFTYQMLQTRIKILVYHSIMAMYIRITQLKASTIIKDYAETQTTLETFEQNNGKYGG